MYRLIDELGRIVIPREIRKAMNIIPGDLLKFELISEVEKPLVLVISKEERFKLCLGCGFYCNNEDNFCANCGLDFSKLEDV